MLRIIYIILYPLLKLLVSVGLWLVYFTRIKGRKHIPPKGVPVLVCANHTGYSDPVFVTLAFPFWRRLCYMAKAPIFKKKVIRKLLETVDAFPVEQRSGDVSALRHAIEKVQEGTPVLVFPEGARRLRGIDNLDALPGVGMIAVKADCLILPVYITPYLTPFRRKTVVIGEAYKPERLPGERPGAAYRRIANETLEKIRELGREIGEGW